MIGIILLNLLILDVLIFTFAYQLKKKLKELKKKDLLFAQVFGSDKE